jgi:quercetin dioxygenase-like cupin family protein
MTITTPNAKGHEHLGVLASRYVDVASLPWVPTRFKGVDLKILMEDKATGLMTALTRFAPGASLPDHEHTELEQSYVLEGSLADDEGVATVGSYVWRPAGSRHDAPWDGPFLFFLKPNKFFDMGGHKSRSRVRPQRLRRRRWCGSAGATPSAAATAGCRCARGKR